VVKTEPPNSNGDEPMHSNRKIVTTFFWSPELLTYFSLQLFNEGWEEETGVEIPASKSTVLRGHESEVFICAWTQQLIYWLLALGWWLFWRYHQRERKTLDEYRGYSDLQSLILNYYPVYWVYSLIIP
jgi:hypothetical protein